MGTLIVVRRDAGATLQYFQETLSQLGGDVELLVDRRTGDRRYRAASHAVERRVEARRAAESAATSEAEPVYLDERRRIDRRQHTESRMPERRQGERRRRMPDTWGTLGFVVVPREPSYEGPG